MPTPLIDLAYLQRLYKGDTRRVLAWIDVYLEEAPRHFDQLRTALDTGDAEGLAAVAHDLRPQAHYLGAERMLRSLIEIGTRARSDGAAACADWINQLLALSAEVDRELRAVLARERQP